MKAKPQTKTLNNERNQRKRKISNFFNNNTTVGEEKGESKKLEIYNDDKNNNKNSSQLQRSSQEGVKLPKNQLVQCPICQKSLPIVRINTHLDVCSISSESSPKKKKKKKKKSGSSASMKSFLCITRERENQSESELQQAQCKMIHSSQKNNSNIQNNAFTKMMKSSLDMVRSNNTLGNSGKSNCNERKKKTQRFHLHPDWTLTWKDENNGEDEDDDDEKVALPAEDEIVWSSSTVIQKELLLADKNGKKNNETQVVGIGVPSIVSDYEDVELVISSSIQMKGLSSDNDDSHPLINYKMSRLSIPVLKSMLQKLIRRRVPSAAVHIALELALKSWREFIRRLPIIIIEDSTIHPEFPLLVWAMVSESKGGFNFGKEELSSSSSSQTPKIPPLHFLKRFLQIVYEVASCSYQDILMKDNCNDDGDDKMTIMSLRNSVIQKEFGDFLNDKNESEGEETEKVDESLILRSILLRAHYGGMKGDIIMLLKYAQAWRLRFLLSSTHHHDDDKQQQHTHNIQKEEWNRVPFKLHSKSNKVSSKIVDSLLSQKPRIEPLSMKHMSFAGIDFHCSSILEDILLEQQGKLMMHQVTTIVSSMIPPEPKPPAHYYFKHQSSSSSFPEEETNDKWVHKNVFSLMKTAMWKFSSGVNHRQDLSCYAGDDKTIVTEEVVVVRKEDEILQKAWNIIHPHVSTYARGYIQSKLNR